MRISFYESAGDFRGKFLQLVSIGEVQDDKVHVAVSDSYWGAKATLPGYTTTMGGGLETKNLNRETYSR